MEVNKQDSDDHLQPESETSFGQASVLSEDEVICLNEEDAVPRPILLLPVPEHLRSYTPIQDSNRMSSQALSLAGSSSGVSSLSDRSEEVSSRCSMQSERSLSPTVSKELISDILTSLEVQKESSKMTSITSSSLKHSPIKARRINSKRTQDSDMSAMGLPTSFGPLKAMKRKASDSYRQDVDMDIDTIVESCFSKRFTFEPNDWKLPDPALGFTTKPWALEQFLDLKQKLNTVKELLNDLSLQDWHAHTRRRMKAGNVIWQLRKKINPELPTQAWCKFYENVSSFPLVPQKAIARKHLNCVHLCEAPGAFIAALNHYLNTNFDMGFKFDWRAVTLNPYYEGNPLSCMINDDRLILQTLDKWLFGKDYTGDIMNIENLTNIVEAASSMGEVLLVTADGSIDCQGNPAEQEENISWLLYCETIAGLKLLAPGGSFLVKMFTFYEHLSICLMYLLNCVFGSVTVNKPVTSKEGNSEVYVVCCDYLGACNIGPWLNVLTTCYGPHAPQKSLFPLETIPQTFIDQLYTCANHFKRFQTDVIQENIRSFHYPIGKDNYITPATRHRVAVKFFERYKLKKLDRSLCLVKEKQVVDVETPNIDQRTEEGSFSDSQKRLELTPIEELKYLKDDLHHLEVAWPGDLDVFWMGLPENPGGFRIIRGKPITKVNTSKFCLGGLLKLRNRVREIASIHFKMKVSQETSQSDTREFPWPDACGKISHSSVTTLDFKTKLWTSLEDGSNATNQKNACMEILSTIESKVSIDGCLELRGYPLLTQFNVGLVYLLGHMFEQIGFVRPNGQDIRILFFKHRKFHPKLKNYWDEVATVMDDDREDVLSVVSISNLSDGDFYKYVLQINNHCVVEQIQDLLVALSAE